MANIAQWFFQQSSKTVFFSSKRDFYKSACNAKVFVKVFWKNWMNRKKAKVNKLPWTVNQAHAAQSWRISSFSIVLLNCFEDFVKRSPNMVCILLKIYKSFWFFLLPHVTGDKYGWYIFQSIGFIVLRVMCYKKHCWFASTYARESFVENLCGLLSLVKNLFPKSERNFSLLQVKLTVLVVNLKKNSVFYFNS